MSGLLHISDTHFGTERPPVVAALERLTRELAPDLVVLSGDITQRATHAQFDAACAFVRRLAVPLVLTIPGNHDIPLYNVGARAFSPYKRYSRVFGDDLEPGFESAEWLVQTLNTTRPYRHKDGEVSPAQIERVAQKLMRATPAQLRVVVTHQPVLVNREQDLENLLHGREAAVPRWSACGADAVLGGHIHLPYVRPLRETFAGCRDNAWAVQAGTAVSSRIRAGVPNSVNLLRRDFDGGVRTLIVEQWDHVADSAGFVRSELHRLPLADFAGSAP